MIKKYLSLLFITIFFVPQIFIKASSESTSPQTSQKNIIVPSSIQKTSELPDITTLYSLLTDQAASQAKFMLAQKIHQSVRKPLYFLLAHNGMALATLLFSPETDGEKILQFTAERLMDYGAQTLYAYARGATDATLSLLQKTSFDLYVKPIALGTTGIIGMSIVCSAIPSPFIAASAYSGFQGMTVSSGINLAKNALSKGLESTAVKKAMRIIRKPESSLFKNAFIIAGALGLTALTPFALTHAGMLVETLSTNALTTYITSTMALGATLDALSEISKTSTYITYYQAGKNTIESLKENLQYIQNTVSNFIELNIQEPSDKTKKPTPTTPPVQQSVAPATIDSQTSKKTWKDSISSFIQALNPFAQRTSPGGDLDYYFVD